VRNINDFVVISKCFVNGFNFSLFVTCKEFIACIGLFSFHNIIKEFDSILLNFDLIIVFIGFIEIAFIERFIVFLGT
jgi:hypothetical protein